MASFKGTVIKLYRKIKSKFSMPSTKRSAFYTIDTLYFNVIGRTEHALIDQQADSLVEQMNQLVMLEFLQNAPKTPPIRRL